MQRIIGHRGAAGLAPENTLPALQVALNLKLYGIEVDVRKTKDNQLVLCHDKDLNRLVGNDTKIRDATLAELKQIPLPAGTTILSLREALELVGDKLLFIELKANGCEELLLETLAAFERANVAVCSFKLDILDKLHNLKPELKLYALERTKAILIVQRARSSGYRGIGINIWILNPLMYWLAHRAHLDVFVYFTLNSRFLASFMRLFYPKVAFCTDYPDRFVSRRFKKLLKSKNRS